MRAQHVDRGLCTRLLVAAAALRTHPLDDGAATRDAALAARRERAQHAAAVLCLRLGQMRWRQQREDATTASSARGLFSDALSLLTPLARTPRVDALRAATLRMLAVAVVREVEASEEQGTCDEGEVVVASAATATAPLARASQAASLQTRQQQAHQPQRAPPPPTSERNRSRSRSHTRSRSSSSSRRRVAILPLAREHIERGRASTARASARTVTCEYGGGTLLPLHVAAAAATSSARAPKRQRMHNNGDEQRAKRARQGGARSRRALVRSEHERMLLESPEWIEKMRTVAQSAR